MGAWRESNVRRIFVETDTELNNRRILIMDPMCVLPYGHNIPAVTYYSDYLKQFYSRTEVICCKELPLLPHTQQFSRSFSYYYSDFVPLKSVAGSADGKKKAIPAASKVHHNFDYETMAVEDFERITEAFSIHYDDTLFYPSADFYGIIGALKAIERLPKDLRATLDPTTYRRYGNVYPFPTRSRWM